MDTDYFEELHRNASTNLTAAAPTFHLPADLVTRLEQSLSLQTTWERYAGLVDHALTHDSRAVLTYDHAQGIEDVSVEYWRSVRDILRYALEQLEDLRDTFRMLVAWFADKPGLDEDLRMCQRILEHCDRRIAAIRQMLDDWDPEDPSDDDTDSDDEESDIDRRLADLEREIGDANREIAEADRELARLAGEDEEDEKEKEDDKKKH